MMKEIQTRGPIVVDFEVFPDFMCYKSGVYSHTWGVCTSPGGNCHHAVRLIGWGVESGVPYWLATNSWGKQWGEDGLFKIKRGVNECGIELQVVAGTPK